MPVIAATVCGIGDQGISGELPGPGRSLAARQAIGDLAPGLVRYADLWVDIRHMRWF
ncbi:hypothetical protein [Kitasatospora phosalacinea]|uniref:hypothetical protein n=1 Tax=Kitasatospora phosalacinea TaxID=2065 RepID=UPI00131E5B3B|nr:hypothetical protein [Kitasatospora phosalacinea]